MSDPTPDSPVKITTDDTGVCTLTLDRPDVRNAFDDHSIGVMRRALASIRAAIDGGTGPRAVVVTGSGTSFCAGADLHWMRKQKDYTFEQNLADSRELFGLMHDLNSLPCPTVARINGPAIGGGTGVVGACDISIAVATATFGFSEVRLGLAPAVIAPFVIARIGERHARDYMLTGNRFDAMRAREIGLVNYVVAPDQLDAKVAETVRALCLGGPHAMRATKHLIATVVVGRGLDATAEFTTELIARLRVGAEGQEGMAAFLEKRPPAFAGPAS